MRPAKISVRDQSSIWLWSGFNSAVPALILLALPLVIMNDEGITYASIVLVSMQAAQSTVIQNGIAGRSAERLARYAPILILAIAVVTSFLNPGLGVVGSAFFLGATLGAASAIQASRWLVSGDSRRFQQRLATRSIVLLATVSCAALFNKTFGWSFVKLLSIAIFACGVFVALTLSKLRDTPVLSDVRTRNAHVSLLLFGAGLVASLFYRNDVNWIRVALQGSPEFELWHFLLVGYAGAQALAGLIVVNYIFSRRAAVQNLMTNAEARKKMAVVVTVMTSLSLCVLGLLLPNNVLIIGFAALITSITISLISGVLHAVGWNLVPYIAGCGGVGVVLFALSLKQGPGTALAAELITILTVLFFALVGKSLLAQGKRT